MNLFSGCVPEERWRCSLEKTSLRESTRHKPQTMRELLASIPGLSFKVNISMIMLIKSYVSFIVICLAFIQSN